MNQKIVASISISGEITLNLHALNNEGGEGNQIITRQVTIIDKNGQEHTVNGISGDMFKHIHAGHLINLAKEKNLPLCSNCSVFNPNRLSSGEDLGRTITNPKETADRVIIDTIISSCTVDDTHGVLVTKIGTTNKNVPRKSVVEFGWTVGIPDKNNTESYIHTKLVPDAGGRGSGDAGNDGQNIFHRPANHGAYAFVCHIEAFRIGFNDISRAYTEGVDRDKRYKAVVKSLLSTFLNPRGAMTSTQKPHITDFKGVVTVSTTSTPAPTISPLNPDYRTQIKKISESLNLIEGKVDAVGVYEFDSIGSLSEILKDLINSSPYKIA